MLEARRTGGGARLAAASATLALLGLAVVACGASVSGTYESDVRFERCYALDWKGDVDPTIRRRCWEEWLTYFSEKRPRDRIEYAKKQIGAIVQGVPQELPASASAAVVAGPLPEPTSVFAPVPMMASTVSASAVASTSSAPAVVGRSPCETRCDKSLEGCLSGCSVAVCEQFCSQKHGRCVARCPGGTKSGGEPPPDKPSR